MYRGYISFGGICAVMASEGTLVVNAALGIPLHVLRPDLWPKPEEEKT